MVDNGNALVKSGHFASPAIEDKKKEVEDAWADLLKHSADRRKKLDYNVDKQKVSILFTGGQCRGCAVAWLV